MDIDLTPAGPQYFTPEGDIPQFKESIKKIMVLEYKRVCSSHRSPIKGNADEYFEKFLTPFDHQKNKVLSLCDFFRMLEEMAGSSPFFRNKYKPDDPFSYIFKTAERYMIEKNLDLLIKDGRIEKSKGEYRRLEN